MSTPVNSMSPLADDDDNPSGRKGHTRTYQACAPCRGRKVKCQMGPVDNPHKPPCDRCKRESKLCFFDRTRRKRKNDEIELDDDEGSNFCAQDGKRRGTSFPRTIETEPPPRFLDNSRIAQRPTTPLIRPGSSRSARSVDPETVNKTLETLGKSEIYSGHGAMATLVAAADVLNRPEVSRSSSIESGIHPNMSNAQNISHHYDRPASQMPRMDSLGTGNYSEDPLEQSPGFEQAIKFWNRLRFVRAGLFTAKEGIAYVQYFFKYLDPLTPIRLKNYSAPSTHADLLEKEPVLLVTILTITSRYVKLSGAGGEYSRPSVIHEKLWVHLRGIIERIQFAQEQFGGGLCGAGAIPVTRKLDPFAQQGLRTLGTIESLMLLTEWHPRALHFPPGDDDAQLLVPEHADDASPVEDTSMRLDINPSQRRDGWLEPAWRSDRMCWMLLNSALALAYEVGVFENLSEDEFKFRNPNLPELEVRTYWIRKTHLKELLWVLFVQTSGRLEFISILPKGWLNMLNQTNADQRIERIVEDRVKVRHENSAAKFSPTTFTFEFDGMDHHGITLQFWEEIAALMKSANLQLFLNPAHTRRIINEGIYREFLNVYRPLLKDWRTEFDNLSSAIPQHMQYILTIEYEYCRVYINSLALQAVISRCVNNFPGQKNAQAHGQSLRTKTNQMQRETAQKSHGGTIASHLVKKWMGHDGQNIHDLIEGCHQILEIVVTGLLPGGYLKHCTVRTYFRIISVATILLKTFFLGGYEDSVRKSLSLLDGAINALRTCTVDDVHIGHRFADMVETLTERLKVRLVRVPAQHTRRPAVVGRFQTPPPSFASLSHMAPPRNDVQLTSQPASQRWNNHQAATSSQENISHYAPDSPYNHVTPGRMTPNFNPNVPAQLYQPGISDFSIMPPPDFDFNLDNQYTNGTPGPSDYNGMDANHSSDNGSYGRMNSVNNGSQYMNGQYIGNGVDWITVPMDPLMDNFGADVGNSMFGPQLDGTDILDVLCETPPHGYFHQN